MRRHRKRIDRVDEGIQAVPVTPDAVDAALQRFRNTGELPEHERLAERTIERALRLPRPRSVREMLFHEAVHAAEPARIAARTALRLLVAAGQDVTSRNLLDEDMELPQSGAVGLHLLGWPEVLARPPYEAQAHRLFDRLEAVRRRVATLDERWFERFASAGAAFFRTGELPRDEFLRDAVLVYGEILALGRGLGGEADAEVMAAFAQAAQPDGAERASAIEQLEALAAEGRIP